MENISTELLVGAITALSGVVAYLYRQTTNHFAEIAKKLSECEHDRLEIWQELARVRRTAESTDETN